jgi:hypothetical protein
MFTCRVCAGELTKAVDKYRISNTEEGRSMKEALYFQRGV